MLLPIVTRELRIRARLPSTAYTRMAAAALLMVVTAPTAMSLLRPGAPAGAGSFLFQFFSWVLLLFALFEGVRASAGVISDERRDGTLGLLFLTDLSPIDILLGKLAGTGLTTLLSLLATVPVLAVAVLVGGVTGGEVFRGAVALINALLLALAAGLWASARAPDTLAALLGAIGVLIAATSLPPMLDFGLQYFTTGTFSSSTASLGLLSPALSLSLAADSVYRVAPLRFWFGQALQPLASVALVVAAGARLRRTWRAEAPPAAPAVAARNSPAGDGPPPPAATVTSADATVASGLGTRLHLDRWLRILVGLALFPALASWMTLAMTSGTTTSMGSLMAVQAVIQIPAALASLAGMTLLTYLAVRSLADARHSGELELLLTTPLGDRELVKVLWLQLRRLVRALTLVAVVNTVVQIAYQALYTQLPAAGFDNPVWQILVWRLGSILHAWLGNAALVWVGFWFGLRHRRPLAAVGWTFGLVGILTPVAIQIVGSVLMLAASQAGMSSYSFYLFLQTLGLALAYSLWIRWAQGRLATRFRATAAGTG